MSLPPRFDASTTSEQSHDQSTSSTSTGTGSSMANAFSPNRHADESPSSSRQSRRRSRSSPRSQSSCYESTYSVPEYVSKWKLYHAERLHIYYARCYHETPKDLFHLFGRAIDPFTREQEYYIERIKSLLKFEGLEQRSRRMYLYHENEYFGILKPKLDQVFDEIDSAVRSGKNKANEYYDIDVLINDRVYEFIEELYRLLQELAEDKNTEAIYLPFCQSFARMCNLRVKRCEESRKWYNLTYKRSVASTPDFLFFQKGKQFIGSKDAQKAQILVSVVEVKKCSLEPPEKKRKLSGEVDISNRPEIMKDLHEAVLGQHAGELLLEVYYDSVHAKSIVRKVENDVSYYMVPGMIVDGTVVYFTMLQISLAHLRFLETPSNIDSIMEKATIIYAKPLDLLVKEERDILIDCLMMLNNIDLTPSVVQRNK